MFTFDQFQEYKSTVIEKHWYSELVDQSKCEIEEYVGNIIILMRLRGFRKLSFNFGEHIKELSKSKVKSQYWDISIHAYKIDKARYGVSCWSIKENKYIADLKILIELEEEAK